MSRPIIARIHLAALSANLDRVRRAAPGRRVWAVVKANAYGHGLEAACAGLAAADGLALIEFDQAARLRALGWQKPILMLEGAFEPDDVHTARALGLTLVVHEPGQLAWLRDLAGSPLDVWVKLNTGMNRLGFAPDAGPRLLTELRSMPGVRKIGVMSHFADAETPGGTDEAIRRFDNALRELNHERAVAQSLANSAAILAVPQAHRDWVRPGIMLYGASPFPDRAAAALGLRAAMSLDSALIAVQTVRPGEGVGYGALFVADAPMRVGIVAGGYADGYPRIAPTGTPIAVEGNRTRTLGRISMDMIAVDLGPVPHAKVGSPVELWGETIPIDEVARCAGTIGYELMCALAPRVPVQLVTG